MNTWSSASSAVSLDFDGPIDVQFDRFDELEIDRPIVERFDRIARRHADQPAVADNIRTLTYDELRRWAYALARRVDQAAPPGRPIGILLPHNALFPVAALACLAAGRPYVPIDLKYPNARIEAIFQEAGLAAVILLAGTDAAQRVPGSVAAIDLGSIPAAAAADQLPAVPRSAEDMAVILYTSGSTGKPKGICNDQRAILQRVAEATNSCHVNANDRFILLSSPSTIAGVREMFAALLNGATLHVTDPQLDGIYSVLQTLGERRITIGYAVPSLLRMLLRLPGAAQAFSHFRVLRVGGDITLDSDLALFRETVPRSCHFFASFSSTETPAVFQWFVPQGWMPAGPRVPIGHARPGIDFMVVGEDGRTVPAGEAGELVVRSRYLAIGQWQDGKLSAGPFMRDASDPSLRILHTGDMVKLREDGLWELFGRKDRQVKIRGLRIDVGEVEAALRSCRGVMDAAVIARRSGEEVSALAAFVAPLDRQDRTALMEQLKQALNARVPQYMRPAVIRLVDTIPQLPGFKPDIRALEQFDREQLQCENVVALADIKDKTGDASPQPPRASADHHVADAVKYAWIGVLGVKSYDADLPWDESNGDSLKAIELWFYIEDKLGFKLPLDALGEHTTPSRLVQAIEAHITHTESSRSVANPAAPLVFLLPGIQSDDPALVRFRAAFGDSVRFKILDYPGWRQTVVSEATFDTIVEAVHATICAEPDCEIYRLAGYSFGGIVAFEVAHRLLASGRRVGFLGLLDTRRWDLTHPGSVGHLDAFLGEPRRLPVEMAKAAMAALLRRRNFMPLSMAERLLMLHPTRLAFWFKRQLTRELRYQALRQWKPVPLDVPTTLFLSDAQWPGEPEDYGWDEMCRPLTKIRIGGDHGSIIQPPHRDSLCSGFLRALVPETSGSQLGVGS
jgi:amino acid adenylation domain-containing protein